MVHYYCSRAYLESGDVIQPGNWGRVLQGFGAPHTQFFREALFEEVRVRVKPTAPSRLSSLFLCADIGSIEHYRNEVQLPDHPPLHIYEVVIDDAEAPLHVGDLSIFIGLNAVLAIAEARAQAENYWRATHQSSYLETVVSSSATVQRRL